MANFKENLISYLSGSITDADTAVLTVFFATVDDGYRAQLVLPKMIREALVDQWKNIQVLPSKLKRVGKTKYCKINVAVSLGGFASILAGLATTDQTTLSQGIAHDNILGYLRQEGVKDVDVWRHISEADRPHWVTSLRSIPVDGVPPSLSGHLDRVGERRGETKLGDRPRQEPPPLPFVHASVFDGDTIYTVDRISNSGDAWRDRQSTMAIKPSTASKPTKETSFATKEDIARLQKTLDRQEVKINLLISELDQLKESHPIALRDKYNGFVRTVLGFMGKMRSNTLALKDISKKVAMQHITEEEAQSQAIAVSSWVHEIAEEHEYLV